MDDIFSVKDKVVIVTGAGRGNGKAIADGFLNRGAVVFYIDKHFEDLSEKNKRHHVIQFDLKNIDDIGKIVRKIHEKFDKIDVLINNAGISLSSKNPYDETTLDQTLSINLKAAYVFCYHVCLAMSKKKEGSIINITSLGAELGFPNNPSYQASKAALKQLTKALARDWARYNIRINNVCPGYILTSMTKKSYEDKLLREERSKRIMLDRWGISDDLVGPCIFLATKASSYVTGSDIHVDGGWTSKGL